MMAGEFRERVRYALAGLGARNAQHEFEHLCRGLARESVTPNIVPATGPVGAGGDQGRDFETYLSSTASPRDVGEVLGLVPGAPVAFVCTLQQGGLRSKVLADVEAVISGPPVALVVAYCAADVAVSTRHAIEAEALERFGVRLAVFDGNAIAEELSFRRRELEWLIRRYLDIAADSSVQVPRGLPVAPLAFVNRDLELAELDELLGAAETAAGPRVALLTGMHGVGKSAVGSEWTNRVRDQFPDGDLYVDFASDVGAGGLDIGEALKGLLHDLGAEDSVIPESAGERRRLFVRLTAPRRLLMFLDHVEEPAQVLATLPTGAGSVVIAASNRRLDELVLEGARLVEVEPLHPRAGLKMLMEIAGDDRVGTSDRAARTLVELCGGLPIALTVCGSSLALERELTPEELASEIISARHQIEALSGPGRFSVASVFQVAYESLGSVEALAYRRMGLWQGPTVTVGLIAALMARNEVETQSALDGLRSRHLIEARRHKQFGAHVLVRSHMAATVNVVEGAEIVEAALVAGVEWMYAAVNDADFAVVADRLRLSGPAPTVDVQTGVESPSDAYKWFRAERHNVMAAMETAAELGQPERVWQFAAALWPLVATQKWFGEWVKSHELGIEAAVSLGRDDAEARLRSQLARAFSELGDHPAAEAEMDRAFVAVGRSQDARLAASLSEFAGVCALAAGDHTKAIAALSMARDQMLAVGSHRGAALADYYWAKSCAQTGDYVGALRLLDRAVPVFVGVEDRVNVGRVAVRRGEALLAGRRFEDAISIVESTIPELESLGLGYELAEAHELLALASAELGWKLEARRCRQRAYQLYRELGHPRAEVLEVELGVVP